MALLTDRRSFLRWGAVAGAAWAAGPGLLFDALTRAAAAEEGVDPGWPEVEMAGFGPLVKAGPDLDLPAGFSYVRFGAAGQPLGNGHDVPEAHDGMAAFGGPKGTIRLVRNQELDGVGRPFGGRPYDERARGGTVTLVFDPEAGRLVHQFPSLTGTVRNCAGGRTPWGSWLSCEETTDGTVHGYERPHGYVFEVPAVADGPVAAEPLRGLGRFAHEAVCVDPGPGTVYLTEDRNAAGLYRFVPETKGRLRSGRLQMLAVDGHPGYDTRTAQQPGRALRARWATVDDPDPADAGRHPGAVFDQGRAGGGAIFARLEGCVWHNGSVVFVSTSGGDAGEGQIWEYRPKANTLTLRYEAGANGALRQPDNVAVGPMGGLILCEDGSGRDRLRFLAPGGRVVDLARNRMSDGEFTGPTFSPDGKILFVNVQRPAVTFAITGPWGRAR